MSHLGPSTLQLLIHPLPKQASLVKAECCLGILQTFARQFNYMSIWQSISNGFPCSSCEQPS